MAYVINKGLVKAWLRKLIKQGILVGPTELEGGDVIFKESFTPDNILLDFKQPIYSLKSFFIPQEETLFTFKSRSVQSIDEVYDEYPRIFFGIRPCDLKAVIQGDRFFGENYNDPYYKKRRENTLLIVIGCGSPESHCFCHSVGIGPFNCDGADIFMVDLGRDFLVSSQTIAGIKAIEDYLYFFTEASNEEIEQATKVEAKAKEKLQENLPVDSILSYYSSFDDNFFEEITARCASCGSCSYICPLCFCYNVVDRENKDLEGKRVRTWDSCIFEGFTRMAGRHNLIKSRNERLRKRFAHKLEQYPETYGILGCTGCGRCSTTCLGYIGMLDVIKKVMSEVTSNVQK